MGPRYFVLGGIIIPEGVWHSLRDGLLGLKVRLKIRGEIKWRYFSAANDDAQNPMRALDQVTRDTIRSEIYALIRKHPGAICIATVVSHEAAYEMPSINDQADIYHLAFKGLTERFQYYLQDISMSSGAKQHGMVVADQRSSGDDKLLRQTHEKFLYSTGKNISRYENFVEGLFVQPSHLSIGIQLSDLVAGAVWRKFERGDDTYFAQIESSFRRSPSGQIAGYGLIKQPKTGWK